MAEASTFTKLFAKRIVPINISLSLKIFVNSLAFLSPDFASSYILGLDAEVKDVSDPERIQKLLLDLILSQLKLKE